MYTDIDAQIWYRENISRYPKKDFNKITSEIKEYELMRDSFLLGVHWTTDHLTSQSSGLAKLVENQQDMPSEFNRAVDKMLDDEIANR